MTGWIIFAIVVVCVLLYCKFSKSVGHIPDFRKPFSLFALVVYAVIMIVCCSCRTQYIPVETVRTEYKTRDSIRHDSVYQQDSVYVLVKGDTVYQYRYKYLYKYQYLNRTDTVIKVDSVQVPYPVEKQLTKWQSIKMELGGWVFGVIIVMVLVIIGCLVYRLRKK